MTLAGRPEPGWIAIGSHAELMCGALLNSVLRPPGSAAGDISARIQFLTSKIQANFQEFPGIQFWNPKTEN